MPAHYGNNGQLSRDERVQLYGIDCEDQVTWHDWTPGVESVNDLVLQNVALVTQKVKFKLPPTKEFDMPYPEPFKLAPGMRKSIPISFRPSKYEPHVDQVQIITKGGSFYVTVKATVKDIALFVPPFIDFGLCPTAEKSETHIDVYNTGTLKASVRWHARPPFTVRCPSESIEVGQMLRCVVEFEPQTASVFDALVVCEARDSSGSGSSAPDDDTMLSAVEPSQTKSYYVKSTGVGKMPHLCVPGVSHPEVHFGQVFPGNRTPKTLEILNTTPVRATFRVRALHDHGEVMPLPPVPFSVSPETGVVEPNSKFTLTFYFQSHTVKEHACQRFQITTPGGVPLVVKCSAFSRPMEVRLSTRSINFGEIPAGKTYSRTLQIHNDSDRPAPYHFINADWKTGVFCFERPQGVVPANSFMVVTVFFGPLAPINYCKQVSCVVKGALAPLTLHLIGSAHTEKARPARLDQRHIDLFRDMQLHGVREHPPPPDSQPKRDMADEDDLPEPEHTKHAPAQACSATQTFLEMMLPADSRQRDITLSMSDLDFGSCSTLTLSEKQVVTITNRTSQKVMVTWMLPGETRMSCVPDERSLLSVYPTSCDIAPRGSHDFQVSFRPRSECSYEGQILEAVVYQKINRTFRLVDLQRFTPPWMVAIKGIGHTMGVTRNDPRLDIAESHVRFRACHPGERTYQIAMLTNPGDTTISYRILPPIDASSGEVAAGLSGLPEEVPFRAWPVQGVIPPHQFHLVALEFAPTRAHNENAFVANFQIVVDYNDGQPKTLRVSGRAWEPKVTFCRGQSMVTFPPTCSGIASSMECMIRNVSEVPITYECKIPTRFRSLFWFASSIGQLGPSESSSIVAHFCPNSEQVFSAPLYCVARCVEDPDNTVEGPLKALMPATAHAASATPTYVLQFVGHGKGPAISLEPDSLDLGAVRACDEVTNQVIILNSSNLTVHYTVSFEFVPSNDHCSEFSPAVGMQALQLGCSDGQVAGRCTESLDIIFRPPRRGLYQYRIIVTPKGDHGPSGRSIFLMFKADVQYPFIQIADLRTEAATLQPQSMMWTQFQVDGINTLYRGEVSEIERRLQAAIGIDEKKELVAQLNSFQLLFGTSAAGSTPTVVYLTLSNPSHLRITFSFQTPKDLNLENAPYWCDEKALVDDREAHFSWVEEHNIYDIQPRSGEILPGDFLHVKMTYHHHSIGTHILPVVFNVHRGRSVLMYLKAHSVAPNVGCLSVRSSVVSLQPVPLHVERGTTQPVELTNSGCIAAPWRIDMQSIFAFNMDNYDFEVLSVTPVEGVLQPQSSTFLHFTFTPLEAKSYSCPVRIEMLKDGRAAEELLFELRADGYDPEQERPATELLFPANLPIQTYAPVPGCGAALSIEILDFDCCPVRAMASRMLVLVNYTSEFVLSYKWEPRELFRAGQLQIEPSSGELSPESHCIIVFRVCCDEPVDLSGEIACFLEWTHISAYGQSSDMREDKPGTSVEYLAFHSDHIHEPMRTGKSFVAGEQKHISVANRLTVSRFRNLMSTAAGQKFLNENLHRTALLASHIPTMTAPRMGQGAAMLGSSGLLSPGGKDGTARALLQPPTPPTSNPLYVRIRAVVADWEVPAERRDEFLVLSSRRGTSEVEKEDGDYSELLQTRRALRGSGGIGGGSTGGSAGFAADGPPATGGGGAESGGALGPDLVVGVLEHMLREVIAEDSFGMILDNMLLEEVPYFVQYEDSARPGDQTKPVHQLVKDAMDLIARDCQGGCGGASEAQPPQTTEASAAGAGGTSAAAAEATWSSPLLLDFAPPLAASDASPLGLRGGAAGSGAGPRISAPATAAKGGGSGGGGSGWSPTSVGGASVEMGGAADESPQRYWEDTLQQYGEIDLETFRRDAGEVMEDMLLEMVDDVIAGRLNWMRPMPRPRARR
mmetsp:Transcript_52322/g.132209  ORF Transcript_52322/g.132209 Transcript_52322/m.132209 type:complete len:1905 (+) Transcript_52322:207-5921(+)